MFPPEATTHAINSFLQEHTEGPSHPGGGRLLRDDIGAVISRDVNGLPAYEICFRTDADPTNLVTIREEIENSALIEKVIDGKETCTTSSDRKN